MLSKTLWTGNASYQALYDEVQSLIKDDVCMKLYDETKPLYLETDASRIGLGITLLQIKRLEQHTQGIHHQTTPF